MNRLTIQTRITALASALVITVTAAAGCNFAGHAPDADISAPETTLPADADVETSENDITTAPEQGTPSAPTGQETSAPDESGEPETTKAPETTPSETTKAPETTTSPETTKTPETTKAPETTKTPETTKAPETTTSPETTKTPETTKASETTKAPETTKTPETTKAPEPEPEPVPELTPEGLVPFETVKQNKSMRKKCTDEELRAAYDAAVPIVSPLVGLSFDDQMELLAYRLIPMYNENEYSMEKTHYNDPYGFFILGVNSCAGATRAAGLCLNMLGYEYKHINEGGYSHQWCEVTRPDGGTYILDVGITIGFNFQDICPHNFVDGVCTICGKTECVNGRHELGEAACMTRAKCKVCGEFGSEIVHHDFVGGVCTKCGALRCDPDVYNALLALKEEYPEGTEHWGDDLNFAHMIESALFEKLDQTYCDTLRDGSEFSFDDLRVGDTIWDFVYNPYNNFTGHACVVVAVDSSSVTVVELTGDGTVSWSRQISRSEIVGSGRYDASTFFPEE